MVRNTNIQIRDGERNEKQKNIMIRKVSESAQNSRRRSRKAKINEKPTTPLHARRQCKTYLPNKSKSETHARQGEMVKCFIRLRRAHVPVFAARPISYACMCYTVTSLSHKRGGSLGLGKRCDAHLSRLAWEGVRSGACGRRYQLSCVTVGCCSVRAQDSFHVKSRCSSLSSDRGRALGS